MVSVVFPLLRILPTNNWCVNNSGNNIRFLKTVFLCFLRYDLTEDGTRPHGAS